MNYQALLNDTNIALWILLGAFFLCFLIQMYFYLGIYLKLGRHRERDIREPDPSDATEEGVSVIICARNEADNLQHFLPSILEQDYPEFEVVVVNDRSTDQSEEVLSKLVAKHPQLRYTSIPDNGNSGPGKKLALTLGLKSAHYEKILLTDADCQPASTQWIRSMTSPLRENTEIVLGYGAYEKKKGLLNLLIRYETLFTAISFLSLGLKKRAYMGVGRNLAYTKSLFFRKDGFSSHYHVASGDDDLFVNQNATRTNTKVVASPPSHTISLPKEHLRDWLRQKQRHLGAGRHYSFGSRARLGLENISRLGLYGLYIGLAVSTSWLYPLTALFLAFQLVRILVLKLGMRRLNEKYLLLPSLLLDPLLPLILAMIWIRGLSTRKQTPWR